MARLLAAASLALLFAAPAVAQTFVMFHDPTDMGNNPGTPGVIPTTGAQTPVNLYYTAGPVAPPDPNDACAGAGTGSHEVCGVDFLIQGTGSVQIVVDSFVPSGDWVVNDDSATQIQGNGGVFDVGAGYLPELGKTGIADKIGTFMVTSGPAGGTLQLVGRNWIGRPNLSLYSTPSGVTLMVGGADDFDMDGVPDTSDTCPTIANTGTDPDMDGVDQACDNCVDVPNPPFTGTTTNRHRTGGGPSGVGQLDDDVDGRGNHCDMDFNQAAVNIGGPDTALMVAALTPVSSVNDNDCGPTGTSACGIHDLNGAATNIGGPDTAVLTAILAAGTVSLNVAPNRHCGPNGQPSSQTCAQDPNQPCCPPFSRPLGSVPAPTLGKAICLNSTGTQQRCPYAN